MALKRLQKKSDDNLLLLVQKYFPSILSAKLTPEGALVVETPDEMKLEELSDIQELVTGPLAWEWVDG